MFVIEREKDFPRLSLTVMLRDSVSKEIEEAELLVEYGVEPHGFQDFEGLLTLRIRLQETLSLGFRIVADPRAFVHGSAKDTFGPAARFARFARFTRFAPSRAGLWLFIFKNVH
jgi:hypothetical protein